MPFEIYPQEVSKNERLPGANPEQMQERIETFLKMKEEISLEDWKNAPIRDLKRMALGGHADEAQEEIDHIGGIDEKGEYAGYTEEKTLREAYYPGWKNEDFIELLKALGEV